MQKRMSFNQIATTLATLSAASLVAGNVAAARAPERVVAFEVCHAIALEDGDAGGDADKDKEKQKDKGKDKDQGDKKKPAKKKGKKEGGCGAGGCGAGSCG